MSRSYLLMTDLQQSTLAGIGLPQRAYTCYGYRAPSAGPLMAFAGERHDPITGCYHLGNGHRLYSAGLMRFYSPDRRSPFQSGGVNSYCYCSGDPVNRSDPSGQVPQWVQYLGETFLRAAPVAQQVVYASGNAMAMLAGASYLAGATSPAELNSRRRVAGAFFWGSAINYVARGTSTPLNRDIASATTRTYVNDLALILGPLIVEAGVAMFEGPGAMVWMRRTREAGESVLSKLANSLVQASQLDLVYGAIKDKTSKAYTWVKDWWSSSSDAAHRPDVQLTAVSDNIRRE